MMFANPNRFSSFCRSFIFLTLLNTVDLLSNAEPVLGSRRLNGRQPNPRPRTPTLTSNEFPSKLDIIKEKDRDIKRLYRKLESLFEERGKRVSDLEIIQDGERIAHVTRKPGSVPIGFDSIPSKDSSIPVKTKAQQKYFPENPASAIRRTPSKIVFPPFGQFPPNGNSAALTGDAPPSRIVYPPFGQFPQKRNSVGLPGDAPPLNDDSQIRTPLVWFSSNAKLSLADYNEPSLDGDDEIESRLTKVGTELELDEDNLKGEVSLDLSDDKIQAHLDVEPISEIFPTKPPPVQPQRQRQRQNGQQSGKPHLGFKEMRNYILKKRFDQQANNPINTVGNSASQFPRIPGFPIKNPPDGKRNPRPPTPRVLKFKRWQQRIPYEEEVGWADADAAELVEAE